MLNLFLTENAGDKAGAQGNSWWIYVVLIVMVIVMLVLPTITNRRRMKEYNQMLDQLRVGDKVRTIGGVVGRVIKITTKGDVKTFILETGAKGSKTTMEFDMAAVGTVLESTYVAPEAEETKKADKKEEKTESADDVATETKEKVDVEENEKVEEKVVVEEKVEEVKADHVNEDVVLAKKKTSKKSKK